MRITLLILFLIPMTLLTAQTTLVEGEKVVLPGGQFVSKLIGTLNQNLYFSTENEYGDIVGISMISYDGTNHKSVEIERTKSENISIYILGDKLAMLQVAFSPIRAELKLTMFDSFLNSENTTSVASHDIKSQRNPGHFRTCQSPSGAYVGILQESPLPRDKPEVLATYVLNINGEIVSEKSYETAFDKKIRPSNSIIISDAGDIHIVKRVREKSFYEFHRFSFYQANKNVSHEKLVVHGAKIADLSFATDSTNKLVIAGFVTNSTYLRHEGYFVKCYDNTGISTDDVRKSLPYELMFHYLGKKADKSGAALEEVYVENINILDGQIYVYMEYITSSTTKDKQEAYHHRNTNGPLALMRLDSAGGYLSFHGFDLSQDSWDETYDFTSFKVLNGQSPIVFYNNFESDKNRNIVEGMSYKFFLEDNHTFENINQNTDKTFFIAPHLVVLANDNEIGLLKTNLKFDTVIPVSLKW